MDPSWTDRNKWVQFVTFNMTNALQQGENVHCKVGIACQMDTSEFAGRGKPVAVAYR